MTKFDINKEIPIIHTFKTNRDFAYGLSKLGYRLTLEYPELNIYYCIIDSKESKFIAEITENCCKCDEDDKDYIAKVYDICKYYRNLIIHNRMIAFSDAIKPYMHKWFIKQCCLEHTIYVCDNSLKDFTLNPSEIQHCLKDISIFMLNYTDFMLSILRLEKDKIDTIAFSDTVDIKHSELQGFIRNYINNSMECPQLFEIWKHLNEEKLITGMVQHDITDSR